MVFVVPIFYNLHKKGSLIEPLKLLISLTKLGGLPSFLGLLYITYKSGSAHMAPIEPLGL
jgi:hypothetical protein